MARKVFPDDQLVYAIQGNFFVAKPGTKVYMYTDVLGTLLADIQDMSNAALVGSFVTVDSNSLIPLFQGPNTDNDTLYAKPEGGGTLQAIYARVDDRLDAINAELALKISTATANATFITLAQGDANFLTPAEGNAAYAPIGATGALTKIAETILGADAAVVTFSSIPATYRSLQLVCATQQSDAGLRFITLRFNNDSTANYDYQMLNGIAGSASSSETFANTYGVAGLSANTGAGKPSSADILIPDYARTTWDKQFLGISGSKTGTTSGSLRLTTAAGFWRSTAAINRIDVSSDGGAVNLKAGSVFTLYGLST